MVVAVLANLYIVSVHSPFLEVGVEDVVDSEI
jgi:hypothetical protein